jgi:hypothetical protein
MTLASIALWVVQQTPEDDDVVAGWVGALVIGLLVVAVVFLGFSLTKQLRKADRAEEAGLYDPSEKKKRHQIQQASEPSQDESTE